MYAIVQLIV